MVKDFTKIQKHFNKSLGLNEESGKMVVSVFISHTASDNHFAYKLASDLRQAGCNVVTYLEAIAPGESIPEKTASSILASDAMLILLSQKSTRSPWINSEIALAMAQRERGDPRKIIPIVIQKNSGIPFFLKDLLFLDFSDEDRYQQNLPRLVETLKKPMPPRMERSEMHRAHIDMVKAQEAVLMLEKEFLSQHQAIHQFFLVQVLGLATVASLLISIVILVLSRYTNADWQLIITATSAFFIGVSIPLILFFRYRRYEIERLRHEIERLTRFRAELQSWLEEVAKHRGVSE